MDENCLRFLLDESSSKQLVSRLKALKLPRGAVRRTTLRNIYLDTPDHALKKAEIALRLRRNGRRWLQVAEGARGRTDDTPGAADREIPAPGGRARLDAIPDPGLRAEVLQRVNGTAVEPFGESVIQRSTTEVSLGNGTRVELAIDVGQIRAASRSAELHEAEIAVIEGDSGGMFDLARALFPEGGLAFSQLPICSPKRDGSTRR
jgi:triphosphatase